MLPLTSIEFVERGLEFQRRLEDVKQTSVVPDYGWYPYGSLSALPLVGELLTDEFDEVRALVLTEPVADLGCGDGDFAMLFAHLGIDTDAVDHAENNYNQMRGVGVLKRELAASVAVHDVDLDTRFDLPRKQYGLIMFLGTLYHLKNPFYVMERLATSTAFCILSTRIARVTYQTGADIAAEPVAYLLDPREANNDPTNFWIFSETGLMRLLDRTGWIVAGHRNFGCLERSNPVEPHADERIFLLLKSRRRYPDLHVRPLHGWHQVEAACRWTMKRFALEVVLPRDRLTREFALKFVVPEAVIAASPLIRVRCFYQGEPVGAITCDSAETVELRGVFPPGALEDTTIVLEFTVESSFAPAADRRELGILVPLLEPSQLPFRIS